MQNGKDNVTVNLTKRVPVFIVYGTALAYENGDVHFSDDIYGHDARLGGGAGQRAIPTRNLLPTYQRRTRPTST